jgi:hypothetical protein
VIDGTSSAETFRFAGRQKKLRAFQRGGTPGSYTEAKWPPINGGVVNMSPYLPCGPEFASKNLGNHEGAVGKLPMQAGA